MRPWTFKHRFDKLAVPTVCEAEEYYIRISAMYTMYTIWRRKTRITLKCRITHKSIMQSYLPAIIESIQNGWDNWRGKAVLK